MVPKLKSVSGSVCAPQGFEASGVCCGIKNPKSTKLDLAIIRSQVPAVTTGVFTQNQVKAAPVVLSQTYLKHMDAQAIIANSGNANACTGPDGMEHARAMADLAASQMGLRRREVVVASTGIIGVPLPIKRIEAGLPKAVAGLSRSKANGTAAAEAIMTSDTIAKEIAVEIEIAGSKVRIGAIAKGAGMINPNMATMLCFITTDADIDKAELERMTLLAVEDSFNRITIDGDMSTNDTVLVMANGAAGNRKITKGKSGSRQFREALTEVMLRMAKKIVSDGERVTKLVTVNVAGAASRADAEKVARAVCNSSLVKSSWNGDDPNWGRIIHAVGYSEAKLRPETIDIYFSGLCAAKGGVATDVPYKELVKLVSKREFCICINLNVGRSSYTMYASDLSPEYVTFNRSEYSALTHK